jgi:Fic family protein
VSDHDRYSEAERADVVMLPDEKARREARNGVRQFDRVVALVDKWTAPGAGRFRLRPSVILQLHRAALEGLDIYAGNYRPADVRIIGSRHQPPPAEQVPAAIEEFCDYINDHWNEPAVHLAAYALWKVNWIHPFTDGNGRTARAVSYLLLCIKTGYRLPGKKTIPDLISNDKKPYYKALEAADHGNLKQMETYVADLLYEQLYGVARAAINGEAEANGRPE